MPLILSELYIEKEYRILLSSGMYFPVRLNNIYVEHYDLLSSVSLFLVVDYGSLLPFGLMYLFISYEWAAESFMLLQRYIMLPSTTGGINKYHMTVSLWSGVD